jgi:hypothetical protein
MTLPFYDVHPAKYKNFGLEFLRSYLSAGVSVFSIYPTWLGGVR